MEIINKVHIPWGYNLGEKIKFGDYEVIFDDDIIANFKDSEYVTELMSNYSLHIEVGPLSYMGSDNIESFVINLEQCYGKVVSIFNTGILVDLYKNLPTPSEQYEVYFMWKGTENNTLVPVKMVILPKNKE